MEGKPYKKDVSSDVSWKMLLDEGADQTKRGSLFHRVGPQERKPLAAVLVLTLETEKLIPLFDLSERDGTDGVNIAYK